MIKATQNWPEKITKLKGWRGAVASFASGAGLVLALPPIGAWPLIFILYPVLYWRLAGQENGRGAFLTAWLFGFGQFLLGLYWLGAAFLVEAERYLLLMPLGVAALPAGLALFYAAALTLWFYGRRYFNPPAQIYLFIIALSVADYARGHVLTGLPWNLSGMAFLSWLPLAQSAALWGVYGLSVLAVWCGCLVLFGRKYKSHSVAVLAVLMGLAAWGVMRLAMPTPIADAGLTLRIVQPAIEQKHKWHPDHRQKIIETYFTLTTKPAGLSPDLIIWPETALPLALEEEAALRGRIGASMAQNTVLVTGSVRRAYEAGGVKTFNSLLVLKHGRVTGVYDKTHLVPFGEYLPAQSFLENIGLAQFTRLRGGFSAGAERKNLLVHDILFAPLICYEIIFPARLNAPRPNAILNVTNDGWFGRTIGPHQHFAQSRMRSIEEGLPLIRAANTGISALVDGKGRVIAALALYESGVLDAVLPAPERATFYARHGNSGFWALLAFCGFLVFRGRERISMLSKG